MRHFQGWLWESPYATKHGIPMRWRSWLWNRGRDITPISRWVIPTNGRVPKIAPEGDKEAMVTYLDASSDSEPIHFPHDHGVLLAFHLFICQSPMTRATPRGGRSCTLRIRPYPKLVKRGGSSGLFRTVSAIFPTWIVSRLVVRRTLSSQVAVVLSPNRVGLVAMGMWSEEV